MSTQDDAQPTPGPWEEGATSSDERRIARILDGNDITCRDVHSTRHAVTGQEPVANAHLIAAAGTAAHELPDKYDARELLEQVPEIARLIERLFDETHQEPDDPNIDAPLRTSPSRETVDNLINALLQADTSIGAEGDHD